MAQAYEQTLIFASYDEDNHFRHHFYPENGSVTLTSENESDFKEFIYEMSDYLEKFQDIPSFSCEMLGCYVHTQFYLALYMCVFILNGFPCGYF